MSGAAPHAPSRRAVASLLAVAIAAAAFACAAGAQQEPEGAGSTHLNLIAPGLLMEARFSSQACFTQTRARNAGYTVSVFDPQAANVTYCARCLTERAECLGRLQQAPAGGDGRGWGGGEGP